MATITSIVYKPAGKAGEGEYVRVPTDSAQLVAGFGIESDLKGGEPGRHLNILSQASVDEMVREGYHGFPGAFGEQIIVAGIEIDQLAPGARLRLGSSANVEIVKARTGCTKLEANQGMPKDRTAGKLGMMADVVVGGPIRVGDEVEVLSIES